jgi:YD repeat-containing protein
VTGPVSGATTTYTYDDYGRVETVTDTDDYTVTKTYDALNRLIQRTFPDDTTETLTYERLDLVTETDRLGRVTRHFYDRAGRRTATRDPLGRVIRQEWCGCGSLQALVDANGNRTSWERDVQGRVVTETRADGTTETNYTYDATGRIATVTDPEGQVTTYTYSADNQIDDIMFTNETIATADLSFSYDTVYARVATMVDGTGTTAYTYVDAGELGAGQVETIDGPLSNDVIAFVYDELGRALERSVNGSANSVTWTFDALNRVTSEENVLGLFEYTYDGLSGRLAALPTRTTRLACTPISAPRRT